MTERSAVSHTKVIIRRGLSRDEAADYLGIGTTKFDELVSIGLVAQPRRCGSRNLWDIRELDIAFESLPRKDSPVTGGSWDDA